MRSEEHKESQGGEGGNKRLALSTLPAARKALARVAREYWRGDISTEKARCMGYLLSTLVNAFKTEAEARIEARLEALEASLKPTPGRAAEATVPQRLQL